MARILISAGEASGDIHAAAVTRELKNIAPDTEVFGMGGDCLREAGGEVLFDIKEHGVMGFAEIVCKLPALFKLKKAFAKVIEERKPDCLVVVDYPGFNMRLAKLAKAKGIPVVSYISPSAWAWHKSRAKSVAQIVNKVAAIFPFEYEVYKNAGADTEFVGHPLVDIVKPHLSKEAAWKKAGKNADRDLILLLPGSRLMEIQKMLPTMLQAAKLILKTSRYRFYYATGQNNSSENAGRYGKAAGVPVKIIEGDNYDVMFSADLALATSGTVTLEAALCGLGSVIVYKTSPITAFIARRVINIPNIGLPNIVAGKRILPELLQEEFTPERLQQEALALLEPERNTQMKKDLAYVSERLGEPGAVHRVAELVLRIAEEKQ